jgi:hypothetical protein
MLYNCFTVVAGTTAKEFEMSITQKQIFINDLNSIIAFCEEAKALNCTEEEYHSLNTKAFIANIILHNIVEATAEVLKGKSVFEVSN